MEDKLNEVLREQHLQQQRQMAASTPNNHNQNNSKSGSASPSIEDPEDTIEYDNDESKSLAGESTAIAPVMLTTSQRRLGHCYFLLQLIISVCNLGCFTLKLPFVVFVIRAVLEVLRAKAQAEAQVARYEDPYGVDEGMIHDSEINSWTAEGLVSSTVAPDAGSGSTAGKAISTILSVFLVVGLKL